MTELSKMLENFCKENNLDFNKVNYASLTKLIHKSKSITLNVYGESMLPSILNNCQVKINLVNCKYKFGDIVLAKGENTFIVHRLMFKNRLKGDNNIIFDSGRFELVGKVSVSLNLRTYLGSLVSYFEGLINLHFKKPTTCFIKLKNLFFKPIDLEVSNVTDYQKQ